jgi:hypothetical protein
MMRDIIKRAVDGTNTRGQDKSDGQARAGQAGV